jgi:hypothetical protein
MYVVNRSVAIIRPKQSYVDWANSVANDDHTYSLEEPSDECNVFLLPGYKSDQHGDAILKKLYREIFDVEFSSCTTDTTEWPVIRDFKQFLGWFDVELHSMVFDPQENDIEKEPYYT